MKIAFGWESNYFLLEIRTGSICSDDGGDGDSADDAGVDGMKVIGDRDEMLMTLTILKRIRSI